MPDKQNRLGADMKTVITRSLIVNTASATCADPEGGGGQGMKNHKNIGSLSNTGPDTLKNHKATKPDSMLGRHRPASETPFKWCFAGGPMMTRL